MVRRTEDGALKWAFRDFLRAEARPVEVGVSLWSSREGHGMHTCVSFRHDGGAGERLDGEKLVD